MRQRSPLFAVTKTQPLSDLPLIAALIRHLGVGALVSDLARLPAGVVARCARD